MAHLKQLQKDLKDTASSETLRFNHIAYCLLKGRSLRMIEQKNREHNQPTKRSVLYFIEKHFGVDVREYAQDFVTEVGHESGDYRIPKPAMEESDEEATVHISQS